MSRTADHVVPVSVRPDLAMERANLRGACHHCNRKRKAKPVETLTTAEHTTEALTWFD